MAGTGENRSCLHLLARSSGEALERCNAFRGEHDELLLIDDAVLLLVRDRGQFQEAERAGHYCLQADLDARGLADIAGELGVNTVTDGDFAGLLRKHDSCLTWK